MLSLTSGHIHHQACKGECPVYRESREYGVLSWPSQRGLNSRKLPEKFNEYISSSWRRATTQSRSCVQTNSKFPWVQDGEEKQEYIVRSMYSMSRESVSLKIHALNRGQQLRISSLPVRSMKPTAAGLTLKRRCLASCPLRDWEATSSSVRKVTGTDRPPSPQAPSSSAKADSSRLRQWLLEEM